MLNKVQEQPRYELRGLMFLSGNGPSMTAIEELATWFPINNYFIYGRIMSDSNLQKEVQELIFNK